MVTLASLLVVLPVAVAVVVEAIAMVSLVGVVCREMEDVEAGFPMVVAVMPVAQEVVWEEEEDVVVLQPLLERFDLTFSRKYDLGKKI